MADRADPRQVNSIALMTSEGLVGVGVWVGWSGGGPGLSPLSFFFQSFTTGDFKVIGSLDDSLVPAIALCSVSDPLVRVYVAGLDGLLQVILDLFFEAPLSLWPDESLPYKMIFGRHWSSILKTWPAQQSW